MILIGIFNGKHAHEMLSQRVLAYDFGGVVVTSNTTCRLIFTYGNENVNRVVLAIR